MNKGFYIFAIGVFISLATMFWFQYQQRQTNKQVQMDLAASRFAIRIIVKEMASYKAELETYQKIGWDHMSGRDCTHCPKAAK